MDGKLDIFRMAIFRIAKSLVYIIALLILTFVSVISVFYYTDIVKDPTAFSFSTAQILKNPLGPFLLMSFILILAYILCRGIQKTGSIGSHILFGALFFIVMGGCAWWIVNSQSSPDSDSKAVYDIAVRAVNHDLLPIAPTGSYMSLWPFQSGLLLFFEAILRFFPGGADYVTIQWMNCLSVGLALVSGYFLVRKWFPEKGSAPFWCLLMLFCLPYYLLVNYVYGDIPGLGLLIFSTWMFTEFIQKDKNICLLPGIITLGGSIALRKNYLIFAVACMIMMAILSFTEKKKKYIAALILIILTVVSANILPIKFYEYRAQNTMGDGVPAVSYIAMGLQDKGGWNGYHADLYMRCDYQADRAKEISVQSIKESLAYMRENPLYGIQFFYQKQTGQWCDATYGFMYETVYSFDNRTEKAWQVYCGKWTTPLVNIMNIHQSTVYVGALLFCVNELRRHRKKRKNDKNSCENYKNLWTLVWMVTVIGGFMFTLIWEASPRYTLPYLVMLIPYAADGFCQSFLSLSAKKEELFSRFL